MKKTKTILILLIPAAAYGLVTVNIQRPLSQLDGGQEMIPTDPNRLALSLDSAVLSIHSKSTMVCPEYLDGPNVPCVRIYKQCICYNTRKLTWPDAQLFCWKHNMNLVSLESAYKEKIVVGLMSILGLPTSGYWSSGSDAQEEGNWVWTATGQPISQHRNWHSGQPDDYHKMQDCMVFPTNWGNVTTWDDTSCAQTNPSVCEA